MATVISHKIKQIIIKIKHSKKRKRSSQVKRNGTAIYNRFKKSNSVCGLAIIWAFVFVFFIFFCFCFVCCVVCLCVLFSSHLVLLCVKSVVHFVGVVVAIWEDDNARTYCLKPDSPVPSYLSTWPRSLQYIRFLWKRGTTTISRRGSWVVHAIAEAGRVRAVIVAAAAAASGVAGRCWPG